MTYVERIADFATRASIRPDLAALHNAALVRYLDFNDSYLAKGVVASWWQLRKALAEAARGDEVSIYVDGKIYRVVVVEKKRQAEEPHRHRA